MLATLNTKHNRETRNECRFSQKQLFVIKYGMFFKHNDKSLCPLSIIARRRVMFLKEEEVRTINLDFLTLN